MDLTAAIRENVVGRVVFGPAQPLNELRRFTVEQPVDAAHSLEALKTRLTDLEAVLREIRGGYDDFYSSGDNSRLLNAESLIRGLIPPLGDG